MFHRRHQEDLEAALRDVGLADKLKRVEHHSSHAANAYYYSGFDEALIVTIDGYGSGLAGSVSIGRCGTIERVHGLEYPHSLGTFYESVTSALGFKAERHEGKIVGLAAYGDPAVLGEVLLPALSTRPTGRSASSRTTTCSSRACSPRNSRRSTSRLPISTCWSGWLPTTSRIT